MIAFARMQVQLRLKLRQRQSQGCVDVGANGAPSAVGFRTVGSKRAPKIPLELLLKFKGS